MDIDARISVEMELSHAKLLDILGTLSSFRKLPPPKEPIPNVLNHKDFRDLTKAYNIIVRLYRSLKKHKSRKHTIASEILLKRLEPILKECQKVLEAYLVQHPIGRWLMSHPYIGTVSAAYIMTYINPVKLRTKRSLDIYLRLDNQWNKGRKHSDKPWLRRRTKIAHRAYTMLKRWADQTVMHQQQPYYAVIEARRRYEELKDPGINRYYRDAKVKRWLLKRLAHQYLEKYRTHLGLRMYDKRSKTCSESVRSKTASNLCG